MKLKKIGLIEYDPSKESRDPEVMFSTFLSCLQEGDDVAAREVLAAALQYCNKSRFARISGIPRRTFYNFLNEPGSPSLALVAKVCLAIRKEAAPRTRAAVSR
jgi:DNA-binding phage protein